MTIIKFFILALILLWPGDATSQPRSKSKPQPPTLKYNYTFQGESEPDGFRGIKWQTDIATLDPWKTMDVVEVYGNSIYYRKKREDLRMGQAPVEDIIYEFWNGKFASVLVVVQDVPNYSKLRDYCFAKYGEGYRPEAYRMVDVQDFTWNGYFTKMYLNYRDIDHTGKLALYSIAIFNKKGRYDKALLHEIYGELLPPKDKPKEGKPRKK
ncbi:MAG: hypothetical protein FJ134_11400 [Deltaproteobacteria bacterium]|nr:hypothetical protein [Deltaproteobacteria bacterium]